MSLKSYFFKILAQIVVSRELKKAKNGCHYQQEWFKRLIQTNKNTVFGREHTFHSIDSYEEFKKNIPLRTYESFESYIEEIKEGRKNILSSDVPLYLLKTSGTTSGAKYIPITNNGIKHQITAVRNLLCFYSYHTGDYDFVSYKMLFLQGSPELSYEFKIPTARLSGVVYHHVPKFFQKNKLPSYQTNIVSDWPKKIALISEECIENNISVLGGIPPWCLQLFENILAQTHTKDLKSYFKNLTLYIYGGVNFDSYETSIKKLIGNQVTILETYPASEGFFGFQDNPKFKDLLLLIDHGIFYEWIPFSDIHATHPNIYPLSDVKKEETYEMVISTESGLWRYRTGDLVSFTNIEPYKIKVVGRTCHFISAFGEHIIAKEVEQAIATAIATLGIKIKDFFVSPNVESKRYEWRIEWIEKPENLSELEASLDASLSSQNVYYKHLIEGSIIQSCRILTMNHGTFESYRKQNQKIGEQNKVVRLSNTNSIAKELDQFNNS